MQRTNGCTLPLLFVIFSLFFLIASLHLDLVRADRSKDKATTATKNQPQVQEDEEVEDEDDEEYHKDKNAMVYDKGVLDKEAQKVLDWFLGESPLANFVRGVGGPAISDGFFAYKTKAEPTPLVRRTPVILVPSLIGSALDARLEGRTSKYWWCTKNYDAWYRLFLDLGAFMPHMIDCWFESMALQWDPATGLSKNATGVQVRGHDYGGVAGAAYLDQTRMVGLYNTTIDMLARLGWTIGKDLRAAPYDFRLGPYQLPQYDYPRLKVLIEEVYKTNGNQKVAFISLSMGSAYFRLFLASYVTQEWKDTYVKAWFSLDGAVGGSMSSVLTLLTDKSFYGYALAGLGKQLVDVIRTWPALAWMMPWKTVHDPTKVVVYTPTKNYTITDFPQLLRAANATQSAQMLEWIRNKGLDNHDAPGVTVYCIHGHSVPTQIAFRFNTTWFDYAPEVIEADGDGTVPIAGLEMCKSWAKQQKQPAVDMPIKNMFHGASIHNRDILSFIVHKLMADL